MSTSQRSIFYGRRSEIEVVADILRLCKRGISKTQLIYGAGTSRNKIGIYLDYLANRGFILQVNRHHLVEFKVTDRGSKLLITIDTILNMLMSEDQKDEGVIASQCP